VAFISAVVGPLFVFEPNLRPIGDAPTQLAKLSELRVDHDATFAPLPRPHRRRLM
jgi:hypothetical protein